jgi:hypothetical protein
LKLFVAETSHGRFVATSQLVENYGITGVECAACISILSLGVSSSMPVEMRND